MIYIIFDFFLAAIELQMVSLLPGFPIHLETSRFTAAVPR